MANDFGFVPDTSGSKAPSNPATSNFGFQPDSSQGGFEFAPKDEQQPNTSGGQLTQQQEQTNFANTGHTISSLAAGAGKGIIGAAQGTSDLINKIGSLIPQELKSQVAAAHPQLAAMLGIASQVSPAVSGIEKNVGAAPGSLTTPSNTNEAVGSALSNVGMAAFPAEEAVGLAGEKLAQMGTEKAAQSTLEMTRPALSKAEQQSAIAAGQGKAATLLKGAEVTPTARDLARDAAVKGVIDPAKDLVTNVNKVRDAIGQEAQKTIDGLKQNDVIFNQKQLGSALNKVEKPLSLQADAKLSKMYDLAKSKFMTFVNDNPKNLSGLLDARKQFDSFIEDQVPKVWEDPGAKPLNNALRDMRTAANDFISSKLPNDEASQAFKDSLKKQNLMYEARDNMAEKAVKSEVGKGTAAQFIQKHPLVKEGLKYGAGALGAGAAYEGAKHL